MASAPQTYTVDLGFDPLATAELKESLETLAMVCELANGLAVRVAKLEREMTLAQGCILELADKTLQEGTNGNNH